MDSVLWEDLLQFRRCWALREKSTPVLTHGETRTITFKSPCNVGEVYSYTLNINISTSMGKRPPTQDSPLCPPQSAAGQAGPATQAGSEQNSQRAGVVPQERSVPLGICPICMQDEIDSKLKNCPHAFCNSCLLKLLQVAEDDYDSSDNEEESVQAKCPTCRELFTEWEPLML